MLFDAEVAVCLCMVWKCLCCELCKITVVCIYIITKVTHAGNTGQEMTGEDRCCAVPD